MGEYARAHISGRFGQRYGHAFAGTKKAETQASRRQASERLMIAINIRALPAYLLSSRRPVIFRTYAAASLFSGMQRHERCRRAVGTSMVMLIGEYIRALFALFSPIEDDLMRLISLLL